MMDGVSFYFVEDGQLKFDTMVIHELEKKEMVNIGSIFKEKKLKHVDFTGFEFDVKFVFEVNRVDNSITLSQKKENKTEKIIIKYNLKTENKFQDRVFLTIIAFSGKVTSLTLNINKLQVYELNKAEDLNIKIKDKELTDSTINSVLGAYNRHGEKDSI